MKKVLLALLGLILLALLGFFCFQNKADTIRETLVSTTNSALVANDIEGIKADLSGNGFGMTDIIKLTGEVPSPEAKAKAESIAKAIEGISGVDNQLTIMEKVVENEVETPLPNKVTEEANTSPYMLTIVKDKTAKLSLDGYIENEANQTALLAQAYELFGSENVTNNLKIATGAPEDWEHITSFALERLKDVDYGDMKLRDQSYEFTGHLPSPSSKANFLDGIRTVMSNPENKYGRYKGDYIITAPIEEPVVVSEKKPDVKEKTEVASSVSGCQTKLDAVLSGKKILFDNDKASIRKDSYALLDNLVIAIKKCPITKLEIAGHTDDKGTTAYNQRLSSYRANSIKRYFVKKDVDKKILRAIGYGETQPITKNDSDENRAANRRIEFIVKGVK